MVAIALKRWWWLVLVGAVLAVAAAALIDGAISRDHRAVGLVGTSNEVGWPRYDEVREFSAATADGSPAVDEIRSRQGVTSVTFGVPAGRSYVRVEALASSERVALEAAADAVAALLDVGEEDAGGRPSELRLTRPAELEVQFDRRLTLLAAGILGVILALVLIPAVDDRYGWVVHRSQLASRFPGAAVLGIGRQGVGWGPLASRLSDSLTPLIVGSDDKANQRVAKELSERLDGLVVASTGPEDLDDLPTADIVVVVAVRRRSRLRKLVELGELLAVADRPVVAVLLNQR